MQQRLAVRRLRHCRSHMVASAPPSLGQTAEPTAELLSAGRVPSRVPAADRAAIQAALRRDGAVIVTDLPGGGTPAAESAPGYWEATAAALPKLCFGEGGLLPGDPPVASG